MKTTKRILTLVLLTSALAAHGQGFIRNGIQMHDQDGKPVSAHGANIIYDNGKYWMFGEYKTDSANVFTGFSCYSSSNLTDWRFERIVLHTQKDGRMGPGRAGERPKVLRCPATGEYVMLMHSDNSRYKDPCVAYATSKTINGEYTFQGPLLYKGKMIKKWDIGSFVDDDGHGYLLIHSGGIYRLSPDFHSIDSCMMKSQRGVGESPCMVKRDGTYYWISSHRTSWERNDNVYFTANSLAGPWEAGGNFAPKGTLTWNSQSSFVLDLGGTAVYMGDRWSFPRQNTAATYVWLPLTFNGKALSIPEYMQFWNVKTGKAVTLDTQEITGAWTGRKSGDATKVTLQGGQVVIYGETDKHSCYADIVIKDQKGREVLNTCVDFYSLTPFKDVRYISPKLPKGKYTMTVTVADMKPNWRDKRGEYGSDDYQVKITKIGILK